MELNDITRKIVDASVQVHIRLGPGLFEEVSLFCGPLRLQIALPENPVKKKAPKVDFIQSGQMPLKPAKSKVYGVLNPSLSHAG